MRMPFTPRALKLWYFEHGKNNATHPSTDIELNAAVWDQASAQLGCWTLAPIPRHSEIQCPVRLASTTPQQKDANVRQCHLCRHDVARNWHVINAPSLPLQMPGVGLRHTTSFHFISSIACTHEYRSCNLLLETTPKSTSAAQQHHSDCWGHTEESSRGVHAHGSRTSANSMANRTAPARHNCRLQCLGQGAGACVADAVELQFQTSKRRIGLVKITCAPQSHTDLAHVGNHISPMISHSRLLHLQRVLRCRAMSSTSDTFAKIQPLQKCVFVCVMLCHYHVCGACSHRIIQAYPVSSCANCNQTSYRTTFESTLVQCRHILSPPIFFMARVSCHVT